MISVKFSTVLMYTYTVVVSKREYYSMPGVLTKRHVTTWVREPWRMARADARGQLPVDNIQSYRSLTNSQHLFVPYIVTMTICTPFAALIMHNMSWRILQESDVSQIRWYDRTAPTRPRRLKCSHSQFCAKCVHLSA